MFSNAALLNFNVSEKLVVNAQSGSPCRWPTLLFIEQNLKKS
jgi:hypothetical protein